MHMFDLNRWYYQRYSWLIVSPIHIKHVRLSVSYQWATYQKYDRRGHETPKGYGPVRALAVYM